MSDLCLDEFTSHGHCGVLSPDGTVDNDATLAVYAEMALAQADAGAHMLGPSGMMDGQVGYVRRALDKAGRTDVAMLAYTAKYAGAFYGPFREAVESALQGDRKTYQMDPANAREALRELELDIAEGADIVMVKPALPYLDVVAAGRRRGRRAGRRLPGVGRIRDGRGGRRQRLDRPRAGHRGDAHLDPAGRCANDPHLLGARGLPPPLGPATKWMAGLRRTQPPPGPTPATAGYKLRYPAASGAAPANA